MSDVVQVTAQRLVHDLATPLRFGDFVVASRSYCRVDVHLPGGQTGSASTLDRGVRVHDVVSDLVAPGYADADPDDPRGAWRRVLRSNVPALSSGAGLRALSLVDLAFRDARGLVPEFGGHAPVWAIVGYPPTAGPDVVALQAAEANSAGAAGVKMPVAATPAATRERVEAAAAIVGPGRVALDVAWTGRTPEDVARLVQGLPLAWVEDPFPPGNLDALKSLRRLLAVPLACGDEEAHLYHPEVLIASDAVDVVRLDATCQGGLSRIEDLRDAGTLDGHQMSWHMNPRWNLAAASILAIDPWSVEVSGPGAGVDPLAESRPLAVCISDASDRQSRQASG